MTFRDSREQPREALCALVVSEPSEPLIVQIPEPSHLTLANEGQSWVPEAHIHMFPRCFLYCSGDGGLILAQSRRDSLGWRKVVTDRGRQPVGSSEAIQKTCWRPAAKPCGQGSGEMDTDQGVEVPGISL